MDHPSTTERLFFFLTRKMTAAMIIARTTPIAATFVSVNLIECNEINDYKPSTNAAMFKQTLTENGYKTIIRTSKGKDTSAACGMLAVNFK